MVPAGNKAKCFSSVKHTAKKQKKHNSWKNCLFPIFIGTIVREANSFIKTCSLSIQTIPEKMESRKSSLLERNWHNSVSCVPLLRPHIRITGSKIHFPIFTIICHYVA